MIIFELQKLFVTNIITHSSGFFFFSVRKNCHKNLSILENVTFIITTNIYIKLYRQPRYEVLHPSQCSYSLHKYQIHPNRLKYGRFSSIIRFVEHFLVVSLELKYSHIVQSVDNMIQCSPIIL